MDIRRTRRVHFLSPRQTRAFSLLAILRLVHGDLSVTLSLKLLLKGLGLAGLLYVYNVSLNHSYGQRFVQLALQTQQGKFVVKSPQPIQVPSKVDLDEMQIVVGDFNGDGSVYLLAGETTLRVHNL